MTVGTESADESSFEQQFQEALALHRTGLLKQAASAYRNLLVVSPLNFDCLHLHGVVCYQLGEIDLAIRQIRKAIEIRPTIGDAHSNLGLVQHRLGQKEEALASFDRAISLKPRYAEAYNNKGLVLLELGRVAEALTSLDTALSIDPRSVQALFNRARVLHRLGRTAEALDALEQVLNPAPDHADALLLKGMLLAETNQANFALECYERATVINGQMAQAYAGKGLMLQRLGRIDEAIRAYLQAIELDAGLIEVNCNLGTAFQIKGRIDDAIQQYESAIRLKPDLAVAHCNRGTALLDTGRYLEAMVSYKRAIEIQPNYAEAHSNLGATLHKLGRFDEAVSSYNSAIQVRADYASAYWNKSVTQLLLGDFKEGWVHYEWRWQWADFPSPKRTFSCPQWRGDSQLEGTSILIHAEQGLGDSLQFCRYVPMVKALGMRVIMEVPRTLRPLMSSLDGVDEFVAFGEALPQTDLHCPMVSLPLAFDTQPNNVPHGVPYLAAAPSRVRKWQSALGAHGFRVGICWQGKSAKVDKGRSFPLRMFQGIATISGIRLISLHKGTGEAQLNNLPPGMTVETLGPGFDEDGAFLDTAAVMKHCDLVITSDTAIAHLAGALGVPVWVALKFVPDWRWMLNRTDSPWYPSMRLFRQPRDGDWESVFEEIAVAVRALMSQQSPPQ